MAYEMIPRFNSAKQEIPSEGIRKKAVSKKFRHDRDREEVGGESTTRQFEISKQDVSDRERQSSGGTNNRDY